MSTTTSQHSSPCPLCGDMQSTPVLNKYGYAIHRCVACSHVFVNPMPTDDQLRAHYQNPAYFEGEQDQGYRDYDDMHRALKPHFDRRLKTIASHVPAKGRILDVGCADGYFLERARQAGWHVAGVELSTEMAARASARLGIQVAGAVDALDDARFDAITLWEVIEHVPRPIAFLSSLRERLRPGGVLMFSTPNTGHWQAVRRHDAWGSYRPPSHVQYFNGTSARDLVHRAGFSTVTVGKTMPLPPMPAWLERASQSLYEGLGSGQVSGSWSLALWTWRAIRLGAMGLQRIAYANDDVYATLEIVAM